MLGLGISLGYSGSVGPQIPVIDPLSVSVVPDHLSVELQNETATTVDAVVVGDPRFDGTYQLNKTELETGPILAVAPDIDGIPDVGETLTGIEGLWFVEGASVPVVTRAWLQDGTPISGQTASTLSVVEGYRESALAYRETVGAVSASSGVLNIPVAPPALEITTNNGTPRVTGVTGSQIDLTFDPPSRVAGSYTVPLAALSSGPYAIGPLAWAAGTFDENDLIGLTRPVWVGDAAQGPISFGYSTTGNGTVSVVDFANLNYQAQGPDGGTDVRITEMATNGAGSTTVQSAPLGLADTGPAGPLITPAALTESVSSSNAADISFSSVTVGGTDGTVKALVVMNYSAAADGADPVVTVDWGTGAQSVAMYSNTPTTGTAINGSIYRETSVWIGTIDVPVGASFTTAASVAGSGSNFILSARLTVFFGDFAITDGFTHHHFTQNPSSPLAIPAGASLIAAATAYGNARSISFPGANLDSFYSDDNWHSTGVAYKNDLPAEAAGTVQVNTASNHHIAVSAVIVEAA